MALLNLPGMLAAGTPTDNPEGIDPAVAAQFPSPETQQAAAQIPVTPVPAAPAATMPLTFQQKLTAAADQLGVDPNKPGHWAKSLVASTVAALGDAASIGTVPPGAGWLYGVEKTLAARNARLEQQKQLQFENQEKQKADQRADQELSIRQKESNATIAEANAHEHNFAVMSRNADAEYQQKAYDSAQKAAEPFKNEGAEDLGHGLTSEQMQQMLKDKKLDPTQTHAFIDGYSPVIGQDGKPIPDENGIPRQRATWELLGPVPTVTLSKAQTEFLNKYAPLNTPLTEGQQMSGEVYYLVTKRAQLAQGVQLSADEIKARIAESQSARARNKAEQAEKNLTIQEKRDNLQTASIFAPYLASANGDPIIAMQYMGLDPKGKTNLGRVEKLYGPGNLERARQSELADLQKTIEDNQKVLAEHSVPGATPLPDDEVSDIKQEISAAQEKRNQYLGLHPADPPQFAESIKALDKVPADKRAAYINGSATMPPAAKAYLLRHYGLPVPTAPVTPAQPVPASR